MLYESLSTDVVRAVRDAADAILEEVLDLLDRGEAGDFETLRSRIDASRAAEGGACDLGTDDQLDLLECHSDELGIEVLDHSSIADLRQKIHETATELLSSLARAKAAAAIDELESIVDAEDLDITAISTANPLASVLHFSETVEGSSTVYHYRNVDGDHFDLLELELERGRSVFLTRSVDRDDSSR